MTKLSDVANSTLSVEVIPALARERASDEFWVDENGGHSWADFGAAVEAAGRRCQEAGVLPGAVVVTPGTASFDTLVWMFGAASAGAVVAPLRPERDAEMESWKQWCEIGWMVRGGRVTPVRDGSMSATARSLLGKLQDLRHPGLILGTGGTTGRPKLVLHDLSALLATIPIKAGRRARTLPLMNFDHIGGLDMAWRALAGNQMLVAPPFEITPAAVGAAIARHRVEVLPATPSFLNLLLLAGADRRHDLGSLRIVPYGAEPMPATLLSRLKAALPQVDFAQRFGTSETGALPVRQMAGGLLLRADARGFEWKIVDDELWVHSPARALGYLSGETEGFADSGWFRTGDLAERRSDGTIRVLGRRQDLINVGGEKVLPEAVENLLLKHPLVTDCRVYPLPNAVLGQVVAAEVVWQGPESDPLAVKRLLHEFAVSSPECHLPVVVRLVKAIDTTGNLKKIRPSRT